MFRNHTATILALLASLLFACAASAQIISVSPTVIDMGKMEQMQEKEAEIIVTNDGGGRLIIRDVDADCGCTVPTLAKKELAPGESTVINVKFNSKKFVGKVIKMVNIFSNDPQHPTLDVLITADIHSALLVDPASQRVGFTRGVGGEKRTRRVTITATEADDLQISCDRTRKNQFELEVQNHLDGNKQVGVIDIIVPADAPAGKKRDSARVKTNIPGFETVDLDLRAWVVAELGYSPQEVNFRYKKQFLTTVRFAPEKKDLQFKITGAETDLPEIQVEIIETIPNKETLVKLTGTPIAKADARAIKTQGRIKGTLTVFTDLESMPRVDLPITYMIRM